ADMPHLHDDLAACAVHGVGHALPPSELFSGIETRDIGIALSLMADRRCLGDDEAGTRALFVIGDVEVVWHGAGRTIARQGGHDDAVCELEIAYGNGIEQ